MRKPAMTPGAFPHRGRAAPFRVAIGLALAAGAGTMLWGVGTHSLAFASEFDSNAARETPMTLEDRVAALTAELAQVKAETAKLRESQGDTSEDLSHIRASLANTEIGLGALRTTTDENEARERDTAAQIAAELAQVKAETAKLRESQGDTSEDLSHIRASLANSEIGLGALRTTTDENEARERDTAAQIASNLAQVKAETAKLRESQGDTSEDLSHIRASLANSEIGLGALRTTTDENEARERDTAAQIASNLAQ